MFLLHAPTSKLSELLWIDWHAKLRVPPSTGSPFPTFKSPMSMLVESRIAHACRSMMRRTIDPVDSLRIFMETLLRFTDHPPYVRYCIVNIAMGLGDRLRIEHATMILEFAKSVPEEDMYPNDTPVQSFVARSGARVWMQAGAPSTRARPSDPSLLIGTNSSGESLLLSEGESPDDPDGRCAALEQKFVSAYGVRRADFNQYLLPRIFAIVWFSDLPVHQLHPECDSETRRRRQRYLAYSWMSVDTLVTIVQQVVGLRDTLRPLVDFRRRLALTSRFAESPLRLLPLHVAIHLLEFIVAPAASKPWIRAWYHHAGGFEPAT